MTRILSLLLLAAALELIGRGEPGAADITYGSATEAPAGRETMVGVQTKLLYLLAVLQSADERPTSHALDGVERLERAADSVLARWEAFRSGR